MDHINGKFMKSAKYLISCGLLLGGGLAIASENPVALNAKPLRLIVGYAPASGADLVARILSSRFEEIYPKGVIVENKAGAGGVIASKETATSTPDGYTLMLAAMPQMTILPYITKVPYEVRKDFLPVAQIVATDLILVSSKKNPEVHNFNDFKEWSKKKKALFFGTPGPGTVGHFAAYIYADTMQVEVEPVHYKSTGDQVTALQSGDIQAQFFSDAAALPLVKSGMAVPLISTSPVRSAFFPEVPTAREMGQKNLELESWYGIFAPAGTPENILQKISAGIQKISSNPEYQAKMQETGLRVTGKDYQEFKQILEKDTAKWTQVIKASGFKSN